jgi:hypothetical protein
MNTVDFGIHFMVSGTVNFGRNMAADLDIRVQPMLMPKGIDFYRFLIGNY